MLLRLFEVAISSSSANDKVRSSSVRALGNLLRYLPQRAYGNYNTFLYGDAKRSKYLTVYFRNFEKGLYSKNLILYIKQQFLTKWKEASYEEIIN